MLNHPAAKSAFSILIPLLKPFAPALLLLDEAISRRRIRRSYGRMSDANLRDIGLIPHDVEGALYLPMNLCASDYLARAAEKEAAKW